MSTGTKLKKKKNEYKSYCVSVLSFISRPWPTSRNFRIQPLLHYQDYTVPMEKELKKLQKKLTVLEFKITKLQERLNDLGLDLYRHLETVQGLGRRKSEPKTRELDLTDFNEDKLPENWGIK
jgi:hypothetical protein